MHEILNHIISSFKTEPHISFHWNSYKICTATIKPLVKQITKRLTQKVSAWPALSTHQKKCQSALPQARVTFCMRDETFLVIWLLTASEWASIKAFFFLYYWCISSNHSHSKTQTKYLFLMSKNGERNTRGCQEHHYSVGTCVRMHFSILLHLRETIKYLFIETALIILLKLAF